MTQPVTDLERKRARIAIERFYVLKPSLESYARRETGNRRLVLKPGPQSMTDGKTIWIAPPALLANKIKHIRTLCDSYIDGLSSCPACRQTDWIKTALRHEIGHITEGSFQAYSRWAISSAFEDTDPCLDWNAQGRLSSWPRWIKDINILLNLQEVEVNKATGRPEGTTLNWSSAWRQAQPWFTQMCLVAEDVRCDERRLRRDPRERKAYYALKQQFLDDGIEGDDGEVTHYDEMDPDGQAIISIVFAAQNHKIEQYFSPAIVKLCKSVRYRRHLTSMLEATNALESFKASVNMLYYLNLQGYCKPPETAQNNEANTEGLEELAQALEQLFGHDSDMTPTDSAPEPGATGSGDPSGSCDPSDDTGDGGGDDDDTDADGAGDNEGTGPQRGGGYGGTGGKHEEAKGEGLNPAAVKSIMESLDKLERLPENVDPPVVFSGDLTKCDGGGFGTSWGRSELSHDEMKVNERHIGPALNAARLAFSENARRELHRNQRAGRIHGKMLARRVPFGDDRMFARKTEHDAREYHVVIGMDASGSSSGQTLMNEKKAVIAMAEVLNRLGITFEVWAHATTHGASGLSAPACYEIKSARAAWKSTEVQENMRLLQASGANLDGHTLQFYRMQAEKARATDRILMYYTDGAMPAGNYHEELEVLQSEIRYAQRTGITLMAVGMGVDSPRAHGFDTAVIDSEADYRKVVDHLGKRIAR